MSSSLAPCDVIKTATSPRDAETQLVSLIRQIRAIPPLQHKAAAAAAQANGSDNGNDPSEVDRLKAAQAETDIDRRALFEKAHNLANFEGLPTDRREALSAELIAAMMDFWKFRKETFMGFQIAQKLEGHAARLGPMLDMHVNNIGDPFYDNHGFRLNCKVAERAILRHYGLQWVGEPTADTLSTIQPGTAHALTPQEEEGQEENGGGGKTTAVHAGVSSEPQHINTTAGYITCMGSTEGNTYICRQARDYLKGKFLLPIYDDTDDHSDSKPHHHDADVLAGGGGGKQHRAVGTQMLLARRQRKEDVPAVTIVLNGGGQQTAENQKQHPSIKTEKDAESVRAKLKSLIRRMHNSTVATVKAYVQSHHQDRAGGGGLSAEKEVGMAAAHAESLLSPTSHPSSPSRAPVKSLLPNGFTLRDMAFCEPIILYSRAAHYSIGKIKDMLEIHTPDTFMRSNVFPLVSAENDDDDDAAVVQFPGPWDCFAENPQDLADAKAYFPTNRWPMMVPTLEDGTHNHKALRLLVKFFFSLGNPVFVLCNYGTTFTGVHDDPVRVAKLVREQPGCVEETQHEDVIDGKRVFHITRRNYFIACDGALGAAYGSYFESAKKEQTNALLKAYISNAANANCPFVNILRTIPCVGGDAPTTTAAPLDYDAIVSQKGLLPIENVILPTYNLRNESGVMAVSMSTHKFLGSATPGGLVLTVHKYMLNFTGSGVSYIGSPDTSISGSRSGLNVMMLYDYLTRNSHAKIITQYYALYNLARYAAQTIALRAGRGRTWALSVARDVSINGPASVTEEALAQQDEAHRQRCLEKKGGGGSILPTVFNFPGSLSVIFPRPSPQVVDKYSLSCDTVKLHKKDGYCFPQAFLDSAVGRQMVAEGSALAAQDDKDGPFYIMQCAHIFIMDQIDANAIDQLAADLERDAFMLALYQNLGQN